VKYAFQFGVGEVRISSARASNSKWALVQRTDGFIELYTVEGRRVRVLPRAIRSDTQPVFSRTSPDHVFTIDGVRIWRNSLIDDTVDLIAEFTQYINLSAAHAEGDLTTDGWLALCGIDAHGDEHAFVYNLHTGVSGDVVHLTETIDGLKAAYGGWLLVSSDTGIYAHRDGGSRQLTKANGHASTSVYQGRPVLIWCNAADPGYNNNAVMLVDIESGHSRILKSFDWAYAMHTSGEIVSVYDPTGRLPYQIWHVPLTPIMMPVLLFEWTGPYHAHATPRASYSDGFVSFTRWDGLQRSVWGIRVDEKTKEPGSDEPVLVSMENEADADYVVELPVRGGKALPWKMFKRNR
jgi:hypothetical protein